MAQAGYSLSVLVDTSSPGANEVDGIDSFTVNPGREAIDITSFADTTEARRRLMGLKDCPISISGTYVHSDTGVGQLRAAVASGATIYFRIMLDATNYIDVATKIESMSLDGNVGDKLSASFNAVSDGAFSFGP